MAKKSIGEANIKLTTDGAEKVKSDLDSVKAKTEQVGDSGRKGFGRLDDAVGKAGKKIEDSTAGLRKFQGALSGVAGLATGLAGVFALAFGGIIANIKKAQEEQRKFNEEIDTATQNAKDAADRFGDLADSINRSMISDDLVRAQEENTDSIKRAIRDIDEEVRRVDKSLSDLQQEGKGNSGRAAELRAEREQIIKEGERLVGALNEQGIRISENAKKQDEKTTEDIRKRAEELRRSTLDEESQVIETLAQKEQELREQIKNARAKDLDDRVAALQDIMRLEGDIAQKQIDAIKAARAAEQKRIDDQVSRELSNALREAARAVQESARLMNENNQQIERLYQQVVNFTPALKKTAEESTRRRVM